MLLAGCADAPEGPYDFTVSIATSRVAELSPYGGSVQFERDGERVTRDLSGQGAQVLNFSADALIFVRVHAAAREGLHSLTIQRDDRIIHESAATPVTEPLLYHAPR
ncbi:MAG: hypothetical protein AAFU65_17950 [Pseudomonadota bacterium]